MLSLTLSVVVAFSLGGGADLNQFHSAPTNYNKVVMQRSEPKRTSTVKRTSMPWAGHFSAENYKSSADKISLNIIKRNLRSSILKVPRSHTKALQSLEIRNQAHASRGLANSKKIILHTASIKDGDELQAVFIHELGHVVDLGKNKGTSGRYSEFWDGKIPVYTDDISLKFYRLSWTNAKSRKEGLGREDFVSGYAMSTPFEDFAESYLFYRLHGEKFREISKDSEIIKSKYDFMKDYIFGGIEYQKQKKSESFVHNLIWDATLVKF